MFGYYIEVTKSNLELVPEGYIRKQTLANAERFITPELKELEELIVKKAGLWLDSGDIFGAAGRGFERINVACPRSVLTEALERLARAVRECVK